MTIHFGTDGWRAVISEDFTFENVRHVAQAIADWLRAESQPSPLETNPVVVIGFDTRFLSDRYAREVARVMAGNHIIAYLTRADCPTPALSFAIRHLKANAGIMITASHNPPRYNGLKLKATYGGSALPAITQQVEAQLHQNLAQHRSPQRLDFDSALASELIRRFDPMPAYRDHLTSLVDFERLAQSAPRILVDPMYGSGRGYIRDFLRAIDVAVDEIHGELNPGFGGIHPEPIERNLGALIEAVRAAGYDLGLATDGDADRIGAVDATGRFVTPHLIYALVLRHLVEKRGWRGAVVKTVSTTQLVNRLAKRYNLPLYETPVGSNYLCEYILSEDVLIAGEESGGITIKHHIPESDGILMGLLLAEIVAHHQQPLHSIIADLLADLGPVAYARHDVRTKTRFSKPALVQQLIASTPPELAGRAVKQVQDTDVVKYVLEDGSWLLIRPSGTEPVLRIYAEAENDAQVQHLLQAGATLAGV